MVGKMNTIPFLGLLLLVGGIGVPARGQESATPDAPTSESEKTPAPSAQIDVIPTSLDSDIAARLERIFTATGWFERPEVQVTEGVVFIEGIAATPEYKDWATQVAGKTQDVVAVANRMEVSQSSLWDFSPVWSELEVMKANTLQALPTVVLSILILLATYLATRTSTKLTQDIVSRRTDNPLLRDVLAKALMLPLVILGLYLALRVMGLTRLAATILGGTGVLGLVLGIAFRDIAENYLASLLLSIQRPFRPGDNITVDGRTGLVLAVTTRGTTLMTPEGNHVRIPNSTIYKSTITNLTANPQQRGDFTLPVDANVPLSKAQESVLNTLQNHDAVLPKPESLVLVDRLSRSTAVLRVFFWCDVRKHHKDKVRSALIRLSKSALEKTANEVPDERAVHARSAGAEQLSSTPAEGDLRSDANDIKKQARRSRAVEEGANLLTLPNRTAPAELAPKSA
jgi:small conductance mechanosensitive channel